jgi:predicted permease
MLAGLGQEVRYALRVLRRQPGFVTIATLTIALGIGATTMLFSIVDGALLKPLPWPDADRLVRVRETRQGRTGRVSGTMSNGTYLAWRDQPSTIQDIGGWLTQTSTMTGAGDPLRVSIVPTTPNLFRILGVRPFLGRGFEEGEGRRGQPEVMILSYGLWRERFSGRHEVVGQLAQLDERPYTIVGVMPRTFVFPDRETMAWTAWSVPEVQAEGGARAGVIFRAIARLRDGATPAQASSEATARARAAPDLGLVARALFGSAGPIDISVVSEREAQTADVRPALVVLLAAVALLMVTATASVASIQLARATTRRREMAVRAALGAGQPRVLRELLVENAMIGLSGGALGVALAAALHRLLPWLLPAGFPRLDAVALDLRVLSFAAAVSLAVSIVCGLLPAWHNRRFDLVETLAEDGIAPVGGALRSRTARTRGAIMAGQVAITCVLLIGAALLARSFAALVRADRGYDPVNVLTARLPFPPSYSGERRIQLLETLVERMRAMPGATEAAGSTALPFVSNGGFTAFKMRSPRNPDIEVDVQATQRIVSPGYFAVMRLRLVGGRLLSDADTANTPPAVVVNRSFVRQYLGDQAVGAHIPQRGARAGLRFANADSDWEVVGVVDDMRQDSVETPLQPEVFASFRQLAPAVLRNVEPILVLRTVSDPAAHVPMLRALVQEQAPALVLDSVMTMEDRVMRSLWRPRLYAVVLGWFGGFALLIAGVGLFGVLSFSVAQRTREIGVRSALGARPPDIVALVFRQALWIVGVGVAVGLAASVVGVRWLSTFLYGVGPRDPLTFVVVPLVIVAIAAVACFLPARRAAKVNPLTALRTG